MSAPYTADDFAVYFWLFFVIAVLMAWGAVYGIYWFVSSWLQFKRRQKFNHLFKDDKEP